jgi:amino acid permease
MSSSSKPDTKFDQLPGVVDNNADDALANLGYKPELSRNRSTLQVAFMSFVLASVPYGLATTLYYPLVGGGPVAIIWGWLAVCICVICVAASLGEITSVYPTAGGKFPLKSRQVQCALA